MTIVIAQVNPNKMIVKENYIQIDTIIKLLINIQIFTVTL